MLPNYERLAFKTLLHRLEEEPTRLISISGPRQCGKTTLIQQALQHGRRPFRYLSADLPMPTAFPQWGQYDVAPFVPSIPYGPSPDARWLVYNWEQARVAAKQSAGGFILVLDEVHHIQDWSRVVKGLWDEDRRVGRSLHVVLLGSAPLVYRTSMHEALTGRFESVRLAHWSLEEMGAAFGVTLEEYVYFGGYPGAAHLIKDEARWRDYVLDVLIEPTLDRDVLALSRIDKPMLLRQLFELGLGLLRSNSLLQQAIGPAAGCGQRHNPGPLSGAAVSSRSYEGVGKVCLSQAAAKAVQPKASGA